MQVGSRKKLENISKKTIQDGRQFELN
jgi:hypothetical protein